MMFVCGSLLLCNAVYCVLDMSYVVHALFVMRRCVDVSLCYYIVFGMLCCSCVVVLLLLLLTVFRAVS